MAENTDEISSTVRTLSEDELSILLQKATTLSEAMPYIREFQNETVVVKYGGAAMENADLKRLVVQDVVLLSLMGMKPVLVHGGGPEISSMMDRLGLEPKFVRGMRVTDASAMQVVEMVLSRVRGELVANINAKGGKAVGLSGKDGGLLKCRKLLAAGEGDEPAQDYGFVGEVTEVNIEVIRVLQEKRFIPVVSPIAMDLGGQSYNINADLAAADIAGALNARKFVLLTDVRGVLRDPKDASTLIPSIEKHDVLRLREQGIIGGGMIPKTSACLRALDRGVRKAHILDGRLPHALLLELLTDAGVGTEIMNKK